MEKTVDPSFLEAVKAVCTEEEGTEELFEILMGVRVLGNQRRFSWEDGSIRGSMGH